MVIRKISFMCILSLLSICMFLLSFSIIEIVVVLVIVVIKKICMVIVFGVLKRWVSFVEICCILNFSEVVSLNSVVIMAIILMMFLIGLWIWLFRRG